ncbi:hypothetical protein GNI_080190 [Gregarina niphandrodes]|uniref:Uncharacterized protein n=1 Tax=Gregarina niphandrodes TaxID=110365 RepID=A0A023B6G5_GRENI|nr:hypothetical protein GNI_080190 [Gregarina niphandrodes]EZG66522.1 hypothetical protein GNI_080190 [Gregarina niphandrodes]|eukprot:XP_011130628.1 hypothetical protein GNI_080190 [Gregarina niphandrodes]
MTSIFRNRYSAYRALHDSISEQAWKQMRTAGPDAFDSCNLAYVELGAIVSCYYNSPYGLADISLQYKVARKMKTDYNSRFIYIWMAGCLLQHAGADLKRLTHFCATQLQFNLMTPVEGRRRLECFNSRRRVRPYRSKNNTPGRRLAQLSEILTELPTVTASEFGQLYKNHKDDERLRMPIQNEPNPMVILQISELVRDRLVLRTKRKRAVETEFANSRRLLEQKDAARPARGDASDSGKTKSATTKQQPRPAILEIPPLHYFETHKRRMVDSASRRRDEVPNDGLESLNAPGNLSDDSPLVGNQRAQDVSQGFGTVFDDDIELLLHRVTVAHL